MERLLMDNCATKNLDDLTCVMRCVNRIVDNHDHSIKKVRIGDHILRQLLFSKLFNVPLSSKSSELLFSVVIQRSKDVAMASRDFMCLSNKLQRILLNGNISAIATIRLAVMDSINDPREQMEKSMGPEDLEISESLRHQVLNGPSNFRLNDGPISFKFRTSEQCFITTPSDEEQRSLRSVIRRKVACDQKLAVLMTYAALFSYDIDTQYLNKSEKQILNQMKENAMMIVKRYLYTSYSSDNASLKLNDSLEILEALRDTSKMIYPAAIT